MQRRRYRIQNLPLMITVGELAKCTFAELPIQLEPGQHNRHGEWYCFNPECAVRQVRLHMKKTAPIPASMHCPACARPMRFVEWLESVPITLLEPVGRLEEDQGDEDTAA